MSVTSQKQPDRVNHRLSERVPYGTMQYYYCSSPTQIRTAIMKNISLGGCCFYSRKAVRCKKIMKIRIFLLGLPESIRMTGESVWVKKAPDFESYEIGVKFVLTSLEHYEQLSKCIGIHLIYGNQFHSSTHKNNALNLISDTDFF